MLPIVYLASTQKVKIESASSHFAQVVPQKVISGVSEQPFGWEEIEQGAKNRLNQVLQLPALSMETGILRKRGENNTQGVRYVDTTLCILRTHLGEFSICDDYEITEPELEEWLKLENRKDVTLGSLVAKNNSETSSDWYKGKSRKQLMSNCIRALVHDYFRVRNYIYPVNIKKTIKNFNGVNFLDIQPMLLENSQELSKVVRKLAVSLLFNKVVVLEARGFLLAGEFMREGYPIVLARKPGKLPGEEICVEYKKEYGTDKLCIQKGAIQPNDRVLVLDDIIATGGTMKACEQLIHQCGAKVIGFIAPFVILDKEGKLMCGDIANSIRYLDDKEIEIPSFQYGSSSYILPPSLSMYMTKKTIKWDKFYRSSNIWFNPEDFTDKKVYVYLDPSNSSESFDILQLLSILYRKDPKKVIVVVPFLEQATQDRIEHNSFYESLALIDTIGKLIGKHTVYTFDLHAEQSQFAFHDMRCFSLVKELYNMYCEYSDSFTVAFPDEGSAKRFGKLLNVKNPIIYSKVREGEKRFVKPNRVLGANETQVLVVDDLVRSGGTMYEVAKHLLENGAKVVDALFAHAPFEPSASVNMRLFRDVWTTDTCPQNVPREWVKINVFDYIKNLK